jgi:hypothetical protein
MPKLGVAAANGVRESANTIFSRDNKVFWLGGSTRKH